MKRARDLIRDAIDADPTIRNQKQITLRVEISEKHLAQIMTGHAALTPRVAVLLESALDVNAEDLMIAEVTYLVAAARNATQNTEETNA